MRIEHGGADQNSRRTKKVRVGRGTRHVFSGDGSEETKTVPYCRACHRSLGDSEGGWAPALTAGEQPTQHVHAPRSVAIPPPGERPLAATVGAVMSRDVLCVRAELSLDTFEGLMLDRGLSGAPVVDADGVLIGYAAASDIVRLVHDGVEVPPTHERPPNEEPEARPDSQAWGFHDLPDPQTVGDVMHPVPVEVLEACTIADAAAVMVTEHVHRIPVVTPSRHVVGIVTSLDLLGYVATGRGPQPTPAEAHGTVAPAPPIEAVAEPAAAPPAAMEAEAASAQGDEPTELPAVLPGGPGILCLIGADGRLRRVSDEFCALIGAPAHELEGQSWLDLVHAEDRPAARTVSQHLDLRVVRTDGTVRWLDWRMQPVADGCKLCRAHDVTARHRAESRLTTQLHIANLLATAKTAGDGLGAALEAVCASEHWEVGRLWWVVPTGEALRLVVEWRATSAAASGRTPMSLPRNAGLAGEAWGAAQPRWRGGTIDSHHRAACAVPMRLGGKIVGVLELATDRERPYDRAAEDAIAHVGAQLAQFVARKRAETRGEVEPRTAQELRLGRVDRLAALGSLAGSMAHQINNALTYVRLSMGRLVSLELSRQPATPVRLHRMELLQEVREGIGRIEAVVGSLNKISGLDDGPEEAIDIRALLDEVIDVAGHELRHRAQLVTDHHPVPKIRGRKGALQQVFLNLLLNAAQAIPEGEAHLNEICVLTRQDSAGKVVVEVLDTGAGIPPESLERIFEPFFTTRPAGQGLGLGLTVCKDIVTSLGGDIAAQSTLGHGATMRVILQPMEHAAEVMPRAPSPDPSAPTYRMDPDVRARVLIIDDDRPVAAALALALDPHEAVVAGSGREALELLRRDSDFDLILCDLMMPEVTGMDVHEAFRLVDPQLVDRFVFMTGGAFTPRAQKFLANVANKVLEKPFSPSELLQIVQATVRDKRVVLDDGTRRAASNGGGSRDRHS